MSGSSPTLDDLARLRRVRDRIDREYAEPLNVEALARDAHMSAGLTDEECALIAEMMAKGTFASVNLASPNLDETFDKLQASGAEVVQEPTDQPYGLRDCSFRDPAGNLLRIQEKS